MHILIISHKYPNSFNSYEGIFFRDQAMALSKNNNNKVGVLAIIPISIKTIFGNLRFNLGLKSFTDIVIPTFLFTYPNIPKINVFQLKVSEFIGFHLFKKYVKKNGFPDVIHIHRFESGFLAKKIKNKFNIPYVLTEHSSKFILKQISTDLYPVIKSIFSESSKNISVSSNFSNCLEKEYDTHFETIPNIVDTDFFSIKPDLNLNSKFIFLSVGFMNSNKNHRGLILAFSKFLDKVQNAELRIIGDGNEYLNLKELINSLDISHAVTLLGAQNREVVKQELHKCNLFVLSSIVETFGVVVIEALSTGTPVLSTSSGGPNDIIINDNLGRLCNHEINDIYNAMLECFYNFDSFDKKVIRSHIETNYSNDAISIKLQNVYRELIKTN